MLYFVDDKGVEVSWHVGQRKPTVEGCAEVQADGDELFYIATNFRHLPVATHKAVVVWKGELARLIYDNL